MNGLDIKNIRKSIGLTQKAFADELKVHSRTVQKWESGETKIPENTLMLINSVFKAHKSTPLSPESNKENTEDKTSVFPLVINSYKEFGDLFMLHYGEVMREPRLYSFMSMKTKEAFSLMLDELEKRHQK